MSTVTMVSLAQHIYNSKVIRANEEFEANSDDEADDLVAVRMAVRRKKVPALLIKPSYIPKIVEAQPDPEPEPALVLEGVADEPAAPEIKHHNYNRRDLRAKR